MYGLGGLGQVKVGKRRRAKWLEEEKEEEKKEKTKDRSVPDGSDNHTCIPQLYNLRPLADWNTLLEREKNQIWIPSVTFANTATQVLGVYSF